MSISDNKKRVIFSLSKDDIFKMKYLYEEDKKGSEKRIYESDTLSKMIDLAYEKKKRNELL